MWEHPTLNWTHADFGVPKYEDTPEENSRMLRVAGRILGRLGTIYAEQGDLERANTYTTGAIEQSRTLGDFKTVGELLCVLTLNYRDLGETVQALDYCEAAIEIFQENGETALAATALNLKLALQSEKQTI